MINFCPNCNVKLVEKKGISKKTGESYRFEGCPNFPNCRFVLRKEKKSQVNKDAIILDELQDFRKEFNERFNGLAEFLLKLEKLIKDKL